MKKTFYLKNTLLAAEIGILCLAVVLAGTFVPGCVLPRFDIPFMVLLSVIPMVISSYKKAEDGENCLYSMVFAGLVFAVLPFCAGWNTGMPAGKLFVTGALVFGITDLFYSAVRTRVASGPKAPFALAANGVILYLASQCFQNLF